MIRTEQQRLVDAAIASRRSVRAFLPTLVAREDVESILAVAARAPSGTNTQPWKAYVLTGAAKERLSAAVLAAYDDPESAAAHAPRYRYYPRRWTSPYIERRRRVGWDLYGLLGLTRENKAGMHAQHGRNFRFFDAPVGIIFTIDDVLETGSWLDYGMFLQNIMIAARGRGLDTCAQAAFAQFHAIVAQELSLPGNEIVVAGMALGYADPQRIENTLRTEREPVSGFAKFFD